MAEQKKRWFHIPRRTIAGLAAAYLAGLASAPFLLSGFRDSMQEMTSDAARNAGGSMIKNVLWDNVYTCGPIEGRRAEAAIGKVGMRITLAIRGADNTVVTRKYWSKFFESREAFIARLSGYAGNYCRKGEVPPVP